MAIQSNFPSVRPSLLLDFASTKQLDSRITYTRASTASFYNGVTTAMAEQNLLLQSQTFNTSWNASNCAVPVEMLARAAARGWMDVQQGEEGPGKRSVVFFLKSDVVFFPERKGS